MKKKRKISRIRIGIWSKKWIKIILEIDRLKMNGLKILTEKMKRRPKIMTQDTLSTWLKF